MIKSLIMRGIKSANGKQELTGRDIIIGANGAGKTTRAQVLGIALMGYVPGYGKLPAETMKLANGDSMTVGIETEAFSVTRSFERKGTKVEQTVTLNPSNGEKTAVDKERRIEQELGKLPVMLDFNEFLSLSDMKRREFIYAIADADEEAWDRARIKEVLSKRLSLPDTADPQQIEILECCIHECVENFADDARIQAGLQAMLDYAKEQVSFWKKEREKAAGAAQKITEYKNDLAETDRSLDTNNARVEELQKELTQVIEERAKTTSENTRFKAYNDKITALRSEIAEIEASTNTGNAAELRDLIKQYSEDIRQVNNGEAIAEATRQTGVTQESIKAMEQTVEQLRDDFQAVKAKKAANETLILKLKNQSGQCPIDNRIQCPHDFTQFMMELGLETHRFDNEMHEITEKGTAARLRLESAKQAVQEAQNTINKLRQDEITVLRDNEQLQQIIRELEDELRKTENFDTEKNARLMTKREELNGILPDDGANEWPLTPTDALRERELAISMEIQSLKSKIAEQTKARNTLANLKSSMVDSTVAGYHADAWKYIAEAVGAKGLQGELVKDTLTPLTEAIQNKLDQMGINKVFYFQTEDVKGKEVFQFGWSDIVKGDEAPMPLQHIGKQRNFDALSTGEQLLLLIALMTTIIERLNPPLKVLVIDNAESLDKGNFMRVLDGLAKAGASLDNIIFSGVIDLIDVFPESSGWHVWDLNEENEATDEIEAYFFERYKHASFRVVPGHWPDFKSKSEVDDWLELMSTHTMALFNSAESEQVASHD